MNGMKSHDANKKRDYGGGGGPGGGAGETSSSEAKGAAADHVPSGSEVGDPVCSDARRRRPLGGDDVDRNDGECRGGNLPPPPAKRKREYRGDGDGDGGAPPARVPVIPKEDDEDKCGTQRRAEQDEGSTREEISSRDRQRRRQEPPSTTSTQLPKVEAVASNVSADQDEKEMDDRTSKDYYFDSYAHHAIHEEMLKDEVRTRTYEMAILQNKHLFRDKIVLDVGCGTGILSMFAAQAGARHVYAVDCSSIIDQARQIVQINGFADRITLIKGKIEEISLPEGVEQVDIIVSEWMGYFLLYESMLDTVIYARDKWLVPGGIIFPDKAVMYVAGIEDGNVKRDRLDFWDDVYGFDMSPIKEVALKEPVVDVVDAKSLVTDPVPILHLDILTCTKDDAMFTSRFRLQAQRNDYVHGFVSYFECAFTQVHKPIGFSTAPFARYTHWKQTVFYLSEPLTICAGEAVDGEISCRQNKKNRRDLDIALSLDFKGRHSQLDKTIRYRLR